MNTLLQGKRNYWILTITGWTIFNYLLVGVLIAAGDPLGVGNTQLLIDGFFSIPMFVFPSHLIRNRLKHHKIFKKLNWKTILLVLFYSLIAALLCYGISYLYYLIVYNFNGKIQLLNTPLFKSPLMISVSIINTWIYFLIWSFFYLAIKIVTELNRSRQEQLQMQTNLKEMQLNNLKGQINPHFMFNSLNNIRGLMLEDVERSREMITRLSEVLRYSLTKSNENSIPLSEELEMVEHYINISKIQLEDRLRYEEHIDAELLNTEIPPMLIQLLIENAVKHGISTLPNGGELKLKINKIEDRLQIKVTNTGQLKIESNSTKLGLKNVKQRLNLLYGNQASFELYENNNEVIAEIIMPIK